MSENTDNVLQRCMWQLLWDFLNLHDLLNSRKGDLTVAPSFILIMASGQKLSMSDIATTIGVSNSTVTDFADQLENKGFIVRTRSKEDRRQVFIEVTESGREWMRRHEKITNDYLDKCLENISLEEQEILVSLITRVIKISDNSPFVKANESD